MDRITKLVKQVGNQSVAEFLGVELRHEKGDRYKLGGEQGEFILASPTSATAVLISLANGNRWEDEKVVYWDKGAYISNEDFLKITGITTVRRS